jgi:uncharacterized protein YraI
MKKILIILAAAILLLSVGGAVLAQNEGDGFIRFAHAVPGVSDVDIYVDGIRAITGLGFAEASNYINAPAGTHTVTVRPAGLSSNLWTQEIEVVSDTPRTLIASSSVSPSFITFDDDFTNTPLGTTRLKVIHALEGGAPVTVNANGQTVVDGLEYGQFIGGFDIPADTYSFTVTNKDTGSSLIPDAAIALTSNTTHLVAVIGPANTPHVLMLTAPTVGSSDAGVVRFVHAVADAGEVDLYASDSLIVPGLAFGDATQHLPLPSGDYDIEVRSAGTTNSLLEAVLTVEAGSAQTVVVQGTTSDLTVEVYGDSVAGISSDAALVSVINAIPGDSGVRVDLKDGSTLATNVESGTSSPVVSLEPDTQSPVAVFTIGGVTGSIPLETISFYGGVYYNAVAVDGTMFSAPSVIFFPTALAQRLESAPGGGEIMVVELPPSEEAGEEIAEVEPTEAPAVVTEAPAVVTEAPTNPPVLPVELTEEPKPTARILLDPGVNLQLRQYPSSQALSLGLAPAGSIVTVNGRAGDLAANEDGTVTIPLPLQDTFGAEDFVYVDPVTLLDPEVPNADLAPEATWVNITFNTPDGGQVDAWTVALYLAITAPNGDRQLLRDLEVIPSNRAGEARATDMTPPPARENVVTARIVGIDPGANLNIRRTPDTAGEVLGRLSLGTVVEVEGLGESGEWAFITYQTSDGGIFSGWISTRFMEYQLNGVDITLEDLQERLLIGTVDEETRRGSISAGSQSAAPTPDPVRNAYVAEVLLDPGANLNMRRTPDVQAEVLVQLPNGTKVIVTGRTEEADWLRTSYEGVEGWIASNFVRIMFNERFVSDINEIPVIEIAPAATEEADNQG